MRDPFLGAFLDDVGCSCGGVWAALVGEAVGEVVGEAIGEAMVTATSGWSDQRRRRMPSVMDGWPASAGVVSWLTRGKNGKQQEEWRSGGWPAGAVIDSQWPMPGDWSEGAWWIGQAWIGKAPGMWLFGYRLQECCCLLEQPKCDGNVGARQG